uniref:COP9 signalosome complex subunit 4 n=1 Tax=Paramoeba aestuarina TaxID=180227 RepID=A0A7S4KFR9_9EUKA|eukprot:CAMPEP_0201536136 /NCGR_PEP_ID=MMETSP0161_2-20130828/61039_1 /ASSEMBLY_ACC=CAM_ASM_000251 /TAXON_ID=180227 /ORGANISM="Neoparamoeba aestuarina, Strain SoJaBio B1-5/56/2" /LENGTH=429 /DNA_ID=CAMNT_0047941653 /DNA_START=144 /DNA_END=1433 /DNA_ORIENTATION=+
MSDFDDDDFGGVDVDDDDFGGVDVDDDDDFGGVDVDGDENMSSELNRSVSKEESKALFESLKGQFESLIKQKDDSGVVEFAQTHFLSDNPLLKKDLMSLLVRLVEGELSDSPEFVLSIGGKIIAIAGEQSTDEMHKLRRIVSKLQDEQGQWAEAARTLEGIDIKARTEEKLSVEVCRHFSNISNLYLQARMVKEAELAINQCSQYLPKPNPVFYTDTWAKLHNHLMDFTKAAICYLRLSQSADQGEMELSNTAVGYLEEAAICAILAPAGPHRLRILGTICKDERSDNLPFHSILKKAYSEKIIRQEEKIGFRAHLRDFQMVSVDGFDVLDKACIEHNILSAGNIYDNISFTELGLLLGVDKQKAEQSAARMIMENRMTGFLDQIEELLYFREPDQMNEWSANIFSACARVVNVVDFIALHHANEFKLG